MERELWKVLYRMATLCDNLPETRRHSVRAIGIFER
jgi:hypothetical protein